MIEVKIPNNITEYKPKFMFGMTGRQVVCVVLTAVCILLDLKFLRPVIGDLAFVLAVVPACAAAAIGWITPYGLPFEKYLKSVLFQALLAPKYRRARNANDSFVVPCDKYYEPIPDEALSPEVLACVNEVREKLGIETPQEPVKRFGAGAKKETARPKYKKSKQAFL